MKKIFMIVAIAVSLWSCQEDRIQSGEIVARVGGDYLLRDTVLSLVPEGLSGEKREFFIKRVVEQWIENQTLAKKAINEGFELTQKDRWHIENIEAEIQFQFQKIEQM